MGRFCATRVGGRARSALSANLGGALGGASQGLGRRDAGEGRALGGQRRQLWELAREWASGGKALVGRVACAARRMAALFLVVCFP